MRSTRRAKPAIVLTDEDHDRLTTLARSASPAHAEHADALLDEIDRARIVTGRRAATGFVRMGSTVEYRAGDSPPRTVTLVFPAAADFSQGRVSILSPLGIALIGLSRGQSMDWSGPGGTVRQLTVLAVSQPAEPSAPGRHSGAPIIAGA